MEKGENIKRDGKLVVLANWQTLMYVRGRRLALSCVSDFMFRGIHFANTFVLYGQWFFSSQKMILSYLCVWIVTIDPVYGGVTPETSTRDFPVRSSAFVRPPQQYRLPGELFDLVRTRLLYFRDVYLPRYFICFCVCCISLLCHHNWFIWQFFNIFVNLYFCNMTLMWYNICYIRHASFCFVDIIHNVCFMSFMYWIVNYNFMSFIVSHFIILTILWRNILFEVVTVNSSIFVWGTPNTVVFQCIGSSWKRETWLNAVWKHSWGLGLNQRFHVKCLTISIIVNDI